MSAGEKEIVRCKSCGHEIKLRQSFADSQTGIRFVIERCESCGELAMIREDEARPARLLWPSGGLLETSLPKQSGQRSLRDPAQVSAPLN